ncbi:conserved virion protein (endogenous virus) [Enterobacter phage phiKDA1]|uniref:Conserved virion protein n=1 Tax=Enterobacter phage phiKDA1 TaxID=1147139 RepID=A0A0A6Z5A3_9CAUD|nr:internal virion lysozyme motif [Enterobacter phage phiKDA1]AFE86143.1 conserved virion protein [Enterobacter phage phiKDA1]
MPVINTQRQGLNLGAAELAPSQADFAVGVGAPTIDQASLNRRAAVEKFFGDFTVGFQQGVEAEGAKAAVRGAMDAQGSMDAAGELDENVKKQGFLLRGYYQEGYLQAAASGELARWKADSVKRASDAALSGMSDQEFHQQEQKYVQQMQDKLGLYLPKMDTQSQAATLKQLQMTSAGNYVAFQKGRAEYAVVQADRALDKNLSASSDEFYARIEQGQAGAAEGAVMGGMEAILGAAHLDKDKKLARAKNYLVSIAQNTTDPMLIDKLQQLATRELGVNAVEVNKELYSEFKRAGSQLESEVRFNISDQLQILQNASPEEQEQGMQNIRAELIKYGQMDVLSPGTQMEIWDSANKLREQASAKYALENVISSNAPTTVLAGMFGGDVDKARNQVLGQFPDTAQGNVLLAQYGASSKDPWAIQTAQSRMSKNLSNTLASLDQLGEDGQISTENQATIATWVQMYQQSTDVGKMALLDSVPGDWKGVVQRAASQGPSNASNIMLDDIRRLSQNKASGRYNNLAVNPTEDMLDAKGTANWFSFGDTADMQRQEGRAAMEAEYRYLYRTNPEALVGKSAEDISTMLAGNIQARKLEIDVAGKPRHVYLPAGSSMKDLMGSYQGDTQQYTTALQQTVQDAVDGVVDPSKVQKVIIQAGTAGSRGQNLTATVIDTDGLMHNVSINNSQVQELAQEGYDKALAGGVKIGSTAVGSRPATFYDHDNGRTVQMNVDGKNTIGVDPNLFSEITANTMQFEGYRAKKGNGSVGFGLHDKSGMPVPKELTPAWAVSVLKTSMEKQYLPAVQKQLKSNALPATDEAMKVMFDLNYHGGNGSSAPVAEAVAQVRKARKQPVGAYQYPVSEAEGKAWQTLRAQPAYKQAQPSRKKYLEENFRSWLYGTRF